MNAFSGGSKKDTMPEALKASGFGKTINYSSRGGEVKEKKMSDKEWKRRQKKIRTQKESRKINYKNAA